jgi:hypothetical protein
MCILSQVKRFPVASVNEEQALVGPPSPIPADNTQSTKFPPLSYVYNEYQIKALPINLSKEGSCMPNPLEGGVKALAIAPAVLVLLVLIAIGLVLTGTISPAAAVALILFAVILYVVGS